MSLRNYKKGIRSSIKGMDRVHIIELYILGLVKKLNVEAYCMGFLGHLFYWD